MKLFLRKDLNEGESYPVDVILSYGIFTIPDVEKGWYVKLTLPFEKKGNFISSTTFEPVNTLARYSILYRRRPANKTRGPFGFIIKGWYPIKDI